MMHVLFELWSILSNGGQRGHIQKNERVLLLRFKEKLTYFEGMKEVSARCFVRSLTSSGRRKYRIRITSQIYDALIHVSLDARKP